MNNFYVLYSGACFLVFKKCRLVLVFNCARYFNLMLNVIFVGWKENFVACFPVNDFFISLGSNN